MIDLRVYECIIQMNLVDVGGVIVFVRVLTLLILHLYCLENSNPRDRCCTDLMIDFIK